MATRVHDVAGITRDRGGNQFISVQDRRAPQGGAGCNVYVRGLPENLKDDALASMFAVSGCGLALSASCMCRPSQVARVSLAQESRPAGALQVCGRVVSSKLLREPDGTARGVGFVQFATVEDANRAIAEMDGRKVRPRSRQQRDQVSPSLCGVSYRFNQWAVWHM